MRLQIAAVGRLRADRPERALFEDYQLRFNQIARPLALGPLSEIEVEDRKHQGRATEADLLSRAAPAGALLVALDERGRQPASPEFAALLARWRDDGTQDLTFLIGGADGISPPLRNRARFVLSFGCMVWPHMLARVMLAEQIYRAATILSGGPYHRA